MIRGMIVSGLKRALDEAGFRSVQRPSAEALGNWQQEPISSPTPISPMPIFADNWSAAPTAYQGLGDRRAGFTTPPPQARAEPAYAPPPESRSFPLGVARGQVAKPFIVAERSEEGRVRGGWVSTVRLWWWRGH